MYRIKISYVYLHEFIRRYIKKTLLLFYYTEEDLYKKTNYY